jgi:hypothetical protein
MPTSFNNWEVPRGNLEQVRQEMTRNLNSIGQWGITKNVMEAGDNFTVPLLHQMIVHTSFEVENGGTIDLVGSLYIINDR